MAESAVSSPNRRAFQAIMNCSAQSYSTRSTVNGDGVHCEKADGGCQKQTTSSLMYVSDASYISGFASSGTKGGRKSCEKGTEGVVTGRVRSVSSRSGQALGWPSVAEVPLQALNSALALVLCICAGGPEQLAHDG